MHELNFLAIFLLGAEHTQTDVWVALIAAVAALTTAILVPIVQWYLKQKEQSRDLVKDALQEQVSITNKLHVLREEVKADRISILQFHNGEQFFSSHTHIKKMSKSFEVCNIGIAQDFQTMQNVPIHKFIEQIKCVHDMGFFHVQDVAQDSDINPTSFSLFLIEKGILSTYAFAIRSLNKSKLIGILTIDYIKTPYDMQSTEIVNCKLTAERLSGYISA